MSPGRAERWVAVQLVEEGPIRGPRGIDEIADGVALDPRSGEPAPAPHERPRFAGPFAFSTLPLWLLPFICSTSIRRPTLASIPLRHRVLHHLRTHQRQARKVGGRGCSSETQPRRICVDLDPAKMTGRGGTKSRLFARRKTRRVCHKNAGNDSGGPAVGLQVLVALKLPDTPLEIRVPFDSATQTR